jgi:hypothetical protein
MALYRVRSLDDIKRLIQNHEGAPIEVRFGKCVNRLGEVRAMANLLRAKRKEDGWIVDVEILEPLEILDAALASANGLLTYVINITKAVDTVSSTPPASAGSSTSRLPNKRFAELDAGQRARIVADQLRLGTPPKRSLGDAADPSTDFRDKSAGGHRGGPDSLLSDLAAGQRARIVADQLRLGTPPKRSLGDAADPSTDFRGKSASGHRGGPDSPLSQLGGGKRARTIADQLRVGTPDKHSLHGVDRINLAHNSTLESDRRVVNLTGLSPVKLPADFDAPQDARRGDPSGRIPGAKFCLAFDTHKDARVGLSSSEHPHAKLPIDVGAGLSHDLSPSASSHAARLAVSPGKLSDDVDVGCSVSAGHRGLGSPASSEGRYAPAAIRRLDRPKGRFVTPELAGKVKDAGINLMKMSDVNVSNIGLRLKKVGNELIRDKQDVRKMREDLINISREIDAVRMSRRSLKN